MKLYSMSGEQLAEQTNLAVDAFLNGLLNDGAITEEQHTEYRKYRLALVPMSYWGRLWNLLKPTDDPSDLAYFLVKPISTGTNTNTTKE